MNSSIMGIFYYIIITFYVISQILFNYIVVSCNNRKTKTASELTFGNGNYHSYLFRDGDSIGTDTIVQGPYFPSLQFSFLPTFPGVMVRKGLFQKFDMEQQDTVMALYKSLCVCERENIYLDTFQQDQSLHAWWALPFEISFPLTGKREQQLNLISSFPSFLFFPRQNSCGLSMLPSNFVHILRTILDAESRSTL